MQVLTSYIVQQLLDSQSGKTWIGSNFDRKLANINDHNAFIRPTPELHSVAEIMSHLTTWQKETTAKIKTGSGTLTDDSKENWYNNVHLKEKTWPTILADYKTSLSTLVDILKTKEDSFLKEEYYDPDFKSNYPFSFVIDGMLNHNIYHLGQLGIIVKFLGKMET